MNKGCIKGWEQKDGRRIPILKDDEEKKKKKKKKDRDKEDKDSALNE